RRGRARRLLVVHEGEGTIEILERRGVEPEAVRFVRQLGESKAGVRALRALTEREPPTEKRGGVHLALWIRLGHRRSSRSCIALATSSDIARSTSLSVSFSTPCAASALSPEPRSTSTFSRRYRRSVASSSENARRSTGRASRNRCPSSAPR